MRLNIQLLNLVLLFLLLFASWLVLSGVFSAIFVVLGIFSCLASIILYKAAYRDKFLNLAYNTIAILKYCLWLIKEIARSSFNVSLKMWQLEPHISPQMAWIPVNISDEIQLAIFANSITLTPGTVTIGVRQGMLHVHSLTEEAMAELKKGKMMARVNKLAIKGK